MINKLISFIPKAAKMFTAIATALAALPVVNAATGQPAEFTVETVIAAAVVGLSVYLVPNQKETPK